MTALSWNPANQYFQPVKPPPTEWIAQAFLTPLMIPTPIATRLPDENSDEDMINGFIRVEAGDKVKVRDVQGAAWDCSFLMHSYSPNEVQAEDVSDTAIGYVAAATGLTVVSWYIVCVVSVIGGRRLTDPVVPANIVRYRSAVIWRIAGLPPTVKTQ